MKNPFDRCSQEYERFRPGYPDLLYERIVTHCSLNPASNVLDIGAGPGKGSIPLIERGIPVISADPSLSMMQEGVQSYPNLRCVCSTAEELPFPDGVFDLITSAQSFHWFDPPKSLPEFARALRPEGFLAVYWNNRDAAAHVRFFDEVVVRYNPVFNRDYRRKDWKPIVEAGGFFRLAYEADYRFNMPMDIDDWIGLARTISYIRAIGDNGMPSFEKEVREGMKRFPNVDCPYLTRIWLFQKQPYSGTVSN